MSTSTSRGTGSWERLAPGILLTIAAVLPCWRVLFRGETFFFRDLALYYLPQKQLLGDLLRQGRLPLWDPFQHGGVPLWASPQTAAAHPTSLLYWLADAPLALGLETALLLLLAAHGARLLARELGLPPWPAAVAGAAFSLSGVMLSLVNLRPYLLALAPLPLMAWALERWLAGRRGGWLLPVLAATCVVSGGLETCLLHAVLLGAWALASPSARPIAHRVAWLVACGALAVGLSAPGWLPALDVMRGSARQSGYPWDIVTAWSLSPQRLPELMVPGWLGRTDALDTGAYWGRVVESAGFPYFVSISIGPIVAGLALLGALAASRLAPRRRLMLVVVALASLALAMAHWMPGSDLLGATGVRLPVRFAIKALQLVVLPLALLAGAGLDALASAPARLAPRAGGAWALIAAVLLALASLPRLAPVLAGRAIESVFGVDPGPPLAHLPAILASAAAWALVAALASWLAARGRDGVAVPALGAAAMASLLVAGLAVNPTASRRLVEDVPEAAALVRRHLGDGRFHRDDVPMPPSLAAPSDDIVHQVSWNLRTLRHFTACNYRIPVALRDDLDGLAPERTSALSRIAAALPLADRVPLLRTQAVSVVLTSAEPAVAGLTRVAELADPPGCGLAVFTVDGAAPSARFVSRARVVPDDRAALAAVLDETRDPRLEVVLVGRGEAPAAGCEGRVTPSAIAPEPAQDLAVDAACNGFVVLALPFQAGIEIQVDGQRAEVLAADVASCAVRVPAGRHVVRWEYRCRRLRPAFLTAIGSAGALVALGLVTRRRARS